MQEKKSSTTVVQMYTTLRQAGGQAEEEGEAGQARAVPAAGGGWVCGRTSSCR